MENNFSQPFTLISEQEDVSSAGPTNRNRTIPAGKLYAMSGHNPHGRLGQPNASYNHLQVPFIPRQPQLAHVHMNDSILRSSPLNWHQTDAAFLNYMSTQHKTPLDLNPLAAFVRPPVANSFGTVDLSFPSHHRHNLTPSPHSLNNTSVPISVTPPPLPLTAKSILSSSAGLPSPNSLKEVMSNIVNGDKISNNGNSEKLLNCESVVAPPNLTTGLFVAHHINHDSTKNSVWNPSTTHNDTPIELIKEKILKNFQDLIERNSTADAASLLTNPTAPPSTLAVLPNSTINNNTSLSEGLSELPSTNHANTSNSHNTSKDSQATTSNDESVDSNAGKKRRRRKPNKTCRLSNNDIDVDVVAINKKHSEAAASNEVPIDARLVNSGPDDVNKRLEIEKEVNSTPPCRNESSEIVNPFVEPLQSSVVPSPSVSNVENGVGRSEDNAVASASTAGEFCSPVTRNRRPASRITSPNEMSQDNNSNGSNSSNQRRPGKRKSEPDPECETIDKIAAMIASSSPGFNPTNGRSTPIEENGNPKDISEDTNGGATQQQQQQQPVDQKDRRFEDVEIKLEEMFAGIDDDIDQTKVKDTKSEGCKEEVNSLGPLGTIVPKTEIKKKRKTKAQKKIANSSSTSDETDHKAKKTVKRLPKSIKTKKGKGKKNNKPVKGGSASASVADNKKPKIKEETPDTVSKFRGPFIHVRTDGSSNVVNAPITEEIAENKSKVKKTLVNQNQNDRNKIRGLHVSTLSMKYDAATTDKTWMCVFCKMGPHKFGLGDLFGPYIVSTTCEDFALSQVDPAEDVFKSKKTKANKIQKRTLPPAAAATTTGNKRKRKATEPIPSTSSNSSINSSCTSDNIVDIFYGMTKTTDTSYEVWVHGDCAVWSSGVHLIGTRIVGLEAAVWGSSRHRCNKCQNFGAMLCCFRRGCGDVAHVPCARKANWNLCDEDFKILCDKHCDKVDKIVETVQQTTTTTTTTT